MTKTLTAHLPLVSRCRESLTAAFPTAMVTHKIANNERTKYVLGLAANVIDGVRGIEALLSDDLYMQALVLCRCNFECLVVAHSISRDTTNGKLFEKESLKHFRSRLKDIGLLDQVQGLDQTIDELHPGRPQQWRELFDDFERHLRSDPTKSYFYSSYRHFSSYVHPDFLRVFETVTINGNRLEVVPQVAAKHEVLLLGLGLLGAVGTVSLLNSETCGIGFPEEVCEQLEALLHEAMDLVAPIPPANEKGAQPSD